jgi:ATP-binding cassette subfamily B protein
LKHSRRLLPYLRRHRRGLTLGLSCLLTTTVFSVASPWVLRLAVDDLTAQLTRQKLLVYSVVIVSLVAVEGLFRYGMRMILIGVSREIEYELRNDLFAHLTRLSTRYYQAHRIGDLMSRATNDMSAVRMVLGPGIMYTANTIATFVAAVALMLTISPRLTGLALLPLAVVSVLVRVFGRRIQHRFEEVQAQLSTITSLVQESLSGIRVVRAYVQEQDQLKRFAAANQEYLRRNQRLIRLFGSLYPAIHLLMGVGTILVLWLGGRMVIDGGITLGAFVAFSVYLTMLQWPMIALGWVVNLFERGEASMGRLAELLEAAPEITDADARGAPAIRGEVEFRRLSFAYDGEPVLHEIELAVPAGATVAIVGPTGSGKSTLVSLLPRLFDAPPGTLLVDGRDVRTLPLAALRAAIGFVPQETFLFSDSVRGNVAFGLPRDGAERAQQAAETAQLAKDVEDFPNGFETFVGERGITLSGGQKQRTALARALALDPRILVLDDSLASVDTETEEAILAGLRQKRAGRTTFLVSHRISTVKDADLIVVLRAGRIVERGRHDELVALGGFYAELQRRQLLERELETT